LSGPPRNIADLGVTLRRAQPGDADAAAQLYLSARRAVMPGVPPLAHADDDVRCWFRDVVMPDRETWLAEWGGELVAVMVLHAARLDQLYVHPEWTGRGVGSELLRLAQRERPDGLWLWTFQSNRGAQRFYERHGFAAVERGDGTGNEERAPDVRYVWPP
jgi:ribosomal protein S18 acetylase RimI-like enzyme